MRLFRSFYNAFCGFAIGSNASAAYGLYWHMKGGHPWWTPVPGPIGPTYHSPAEMLPYHFQNYGFDPMIVDIAREISHCHPGLQCAFYGGLAAFAAIFLLSLVFSKKPEPKPKRGKGRGRAVRSKADLRQPSP